MRYGLFVSQLDIYGRFFHADYYYSLGSHGAAGQCHGVDIIPNTSSDTSITNFYKTIEIVETRGISTLHAVHGLLYSNVDESIHRHLNWISVAASGPLTLWV